MRKIFGLAIMLLMITSNCFAMNFSQPVEIGRLSCYQRGGGFLIEQATFNNGTRYERSIKESLKSYGKGLAQFGSGVDALYVHYDFDGYYDGHTSFVKVGSKNIENTVRVNIFNSWIYRIPSNEGIKIYAILEGYGANRNFTIIGTKRDGTFVKYIDTLILTEKYFAVKINGGGAYPIVYGDIKSNSDTIIISYTNSIKRGEIIKGEFRFKWDDDAQWFSVEHVVY